MSVFAAREIIVLRRAKLKAFGGFSRNFIQAVSCRCDGNIPPSAAYNVPYHYGVPYAVKVAEAYAKAYTNAFRRLSAYNRGANAYADMAKLHQYVVMGRANLAFAPKHREQIEKRFTKDAKISQEELMKRYDAILDIWKELDGEINSEFLKKWNSKKGKDSTFEVFKSQSG